MHPEQQSPYWDRIVGDDWPEIPPAAWNALETSARDGAAALNTGNAGAAARGFDDSVRSAESLEPVRDAMAAMRHKPQAFADALYAAADTFGDFAELTRRTRNQILDVVAAATDRIQRETHGDNNDDGETGDQAEADTDAATTERIVTQARADVVDIVDAALAAVGPQGLPSLDDIAEALGQPGPWKTGVPPAPPQRDSPPVNPDGPPGPSGPETGDAPVLPVVTPVLPAPGHNEIPDFPPAGDLSPVSDTPGGTDPAETPGRVAEVSPTGPQRPVIAAVPPAGPVTPPAVYAGDTDPGVGGPARPVAYSGDSEPGRQGPSSSSASGDGADEESRTGRDGDDTGETPADAAGSSVEDAGPVIGRSTPTRTEPGNSESPTAPTPILPQLIGPGGGAGGSAATAPAAQASRASGPPAEAPRVFPAAAAKAPVAPGAGSSGISAPATGKPAAPAREGTPATPGRDAEKGKDGADLVKDAVGAMIAASAAPTFVLGERVDGDLALARTLLGGIRAAVDSWLVGVDWAVSVMRHQSGVSAFVTSNEGRGWLPTHLYLPREVSTPWLWSVAENSGWEGVADPARILAEFALAWGQKSGAKLSALVSSQPFDPELRRQLGDTATAGSVPASTQMDLATPSDSTLDRLGITGSQRLIDRAAKVTDGSVALRCLQLAVDAHLRVADVGTDAMESVGAPEIRLRILRAIRKGREFPAGWWEELQDADDLLAATAISHRLDVRQIGVGELRPDSADSAGGSATAVLRDLVFQRRCNELVLLLAEEVTRQTLRDAVYAHAQILAHPQFGRPAAEPGPASTVISAHGPR
ncbi:hypothetical protein [Nocardia carnea]|uniref:hypothetical protein n=1 Tax=Nocardia carnea TaxID=37328 RepID=UPI0024549A72|nr:hypothetical protein [Nocardia carnea]